MCNILVQIIRTSALHDMEFSQIRIQIQIQAFHQEGFSRIHVQEGKKPKLCALWYEKAYLNTFRQKKENLRWTSASYVTENKTPNFCSISKEKQLNKKYFTIDNCNHNSSRSGRITINSSYKSNGKTSRRIDLRLNSNLSCTTWIV